MRKIFVYLIRAYQYLISPYMAPSCRFTPSCSAYAAESIEKHGALKGMYLAVRRVTSCHPWNEGGYDPVPDQFSLTRPKSKLHE